MPQGSKGKYTSKQKRTASHIASSVKKRGGSSKTAARIAYATVNKQDHGGKKSGSGRGKKSNHASSKAGGRASHSGHGVRSKSSAQHAKAGRASHKKSRAL